MEIHDSVQIKGIKNNEIGFSSEKLEKACADFESIFLSHMLKTMRASSSASDLVGKSHESEMLYAMFDEKLGERIAEGGGIGLAEILLGKLKSRVNVNI